MLPPGDPFPQLCWSEAQVLGGVEALPRVGWRAGPSLLSGGREGGVAGSRHRATDAPVVGGAVHSEA